MTTAESGKVEEGLVRGFLHARRDGARAGLVLTHGAGGNCQAPLLMRAAEAFASLGVAVLRMDLPFRQKRPFGPPSPAGAAQDRAGLRDAAAYVRRTVNGPLFLGGHSYGGRQASMLAAEDENVCDGLLLFSYPLHPPGRPDQRRTAHFPNLRKRVWFVHGSHDDFGSIEEMRAALTLIPGEAELRIVGRAGHDLMRGKFDIEALARDFAARLPAVAGRQS